MSTDPVVERFRQAYLTRVPNMVANRSIAQTIADADKKAVSWDAGTARRPTDDPGQHESLAEALFGDDGKRRDRGYNALSEDDTLSRRVVKSHLSYLYKFEPFRAGRFDYDTLYAFLFYMVVDRRLRVSYTVRVLKSILSYLRAGGNDATVSVSADSKRFLDAHPYGVVIRLRKFYETVNALSVAMDDDRVMRVVCEARENRPLVFKEHEERALLEDCLTRLERVTTGGFGAPAAATETRRERVLFEFALLYVLGFLTGARIKSTLARLTVDDMSRLVRGESVRRLVKNSMANVFLPRAAIDDAAAGGAAARYVRLLAAALDARVSGTGPYAGLREGGRDYDDGGGLLVFETVTPDRRTATDAATTAIGEHRFFTSTARQLELAFDRVYASLFDGARRARGVRWHSQRRAYIGVVNDSCGTVTASKSVGHSDLDTTRAYINKSQHGDDTERRAGAAVSRRFYEMTDGGGGSGGYGRATRTKATTQRRPS